MSSVVDADAWPNARWTGLTGQLAEISADREGMARIVEPHPRHASAGASANPRAVEMCRAGQARLGVQHETVVLAPDMLRQSVEHPHRGWDSPVTAIGLRRSEPADTPLAGPLPVDEHTATQPVDPVGREPGRLGLTEPRPGAEHDGDPESWRRSVSDGSDVCGCGWHDLSATSLRDLHAPGWVALQ
jgi:hypothetical protein